MSGTKHNPIRTGVTVTLGLAGAAALLLVLVTLRATAAQHARDALRAIVETACVPGEIHNRTPIPCTEVSLSAGVDKGYAILKDIRGATQYLLIATGDVSGIESPALLDAKAPNYFEEAWKARRYVDMELGRTLPREDISLAINSTASRSQDQMHIHVDCVRGDVMGELHLHAGSIGEHWAPLPVLLSGHRYLAMWVAGEDLGENNPFKLLARGVPGASADMGDRTLVVVGANKPDGAPGFVILTDRVDKSQGDQAAGEDLQDHSCRIAASGKPQN